MRFNQVDYSNFAVKSLREFKESVKDSLPNIEFIVNSARFSTVYVDDTGTQSRFPNAERLLSKNNSWSLLDDIAVNELDAQNIGHSDELFISSPSHPWGLHPVHYTQNYYSNLWKEIRNITNT